MESRHALQYHTYFILEGADLKNTVAFAYVLLRGRASELSGTDEGEVSHDVSDEAKQTCTSINSDSDLDIPHWALAIWRLRMTRLAILCCDSVVLKVSFVFRSSSSNSVLILSDSWKIALVCQS